MDPNSDDTTPDTTPTETPLVDTTPPVDDGATSPELEPARAEPTDADARGLEAMEKGLAAAAKATVGPDGEVILPPKQAEPPKAKKDKAPKVPRETPVATGAVPVPGTPEAAAAGSPAVVSPAPPPPPDPAETAINAEVQSLGIKNEAQAARVRIIVADNHAKAAALAQLGVVELADLPKALERHQQSEQVIQGVLNTGATGEQYGRTLGYLEMSVAGNQGNLKAAEAAYNIAMQEANHWAKIIGKEVPGVFDPLEEHPDLQDDIDQMNLSRERALEIVALRAAAKQAEQQGEQQTASQRQEQVAHEAYQEIQKFDKSMHGDPVYMQYHRGALDRAIRQIRAQFPPDEWVGRAAAAYDIIKEVRTPAPAPAPQARGPTPNQPVQTRNRVPGPAGGTPPLEPKIPADPFAALEMGLATVANRR
jgi:hypothetical protein